jgi:hypothetical protein
MKKACLTSLASTFPAFQSRFSNNWQGLLEKENCTNGWE